MGALHEGHLALVRRAKRERGITVVSIFVNPTQFGPGEDFEDYPRREEQDLRLLEKEEVDAVFLPRKEEVYPEDFATTVRVDRRLTGVLCGKYRPGHFDGVTTVVARLFGLVKPKRAYFGWKDAQQLIVVKKMVEDLALGIEIVPVETVREADGLALSSRNAYLDAEQRRRAAGIFRALSAGRGLAERGSCRAGDLLRRVREFLERDDLSPQYLELRTVKNLEEIRSDSVLEAAPDGEELLLATAVPLGKARLIDNLRFRAKIIRRTPAFEGERK
ncbi:MAG: pantoate--beta-alanine ligase [Candidatus Hydrogenedentota bacterium]|nr:MAG: pantoate--beta-alanine ligase [Candidatus Hydrogenedentota bacterium]